jgi:uracil phosphoribosyltransferase
LTAPDLTYTLVRPLEDKYNTLQQQGNKSIVFCFLLNRVHFLRDQNITTSPLSRSRATLCEILAIRALRAHGTGDNTLQLTLAMTMNWNIYAGADEEIVNILRGDHEDIEERVGNAIEMAIISKAKRFIKSNPAQRVINSIWR